MNIIDTILILYLEQFDDDIDLVFSNALDVGVNKFIFPSIHSKYNDLMINCFNKFNDHCFIMAGLHPAYVNDNNDYEISLVYENLNKYKCIAVGEIGIDLYWEKIFKINRELFLKNKSIWL